MHTFIRCSVVVALLLAAATAHAEENERTMWPAHIAGAIAVGGLGSAAIFASLELNAAHSSEVTQVALLRAGTPSSACNGPVDRPDIASLCSTLARYENAKTAHQEALVISAGVALVSAGIALAWLALGPKSTVSPRAASNGVGGVNGAYLGGTF